MVLRFLFFAALLALPALFAATPIQPGERLESLVVGNTNYRDVQIRSINPRTVIFTHAGGMTSLRLRDLPPEWQARFRYDPATEETPVPAVKPAKSSPPPQAGPVPSASAGSPFGLVLQRFGQAAELATEVDLRPKYFELELNVKNQGRRPSCAVFAIVSALEFQHAQLTGAAQKFSEEYLIWATRKTTARLIPASASAETPAEDADEGFSLGEVVAALRAFGIPLQSTMPNTLGRSIEAIPAPPPEIVAAAQKQNRVFVHLVPGRDNATRINNLVHALNAGIPVPVGMAWPNYRSLRTGYLSKQAPLPGIGHAVTLVGYKCATGRLEDAVFGFKNSWGVSWGQGGYGWVTFAYLNEHLGDAALLEVHAR